MSNSIDTDPPDDKVLEEYLRGGSPVSQRYRELGAEQVPPSLDQRVLSQARAAVEQRPAAKSRNWIRWSAPLALAASLVMVVTIVIESGVQSPTVLTEQKPTADVAGVRNEATREKTDASHMLEDESPVAPASPGFAPEPEKPATGANSAVELRMPAPVRSDSVRNEAVVEEIVAKAQRSRPSEQHSPMAVAPIEITTPAPESDAALSSTIEATPPPAVPAPPPSTAIQQTTSVRPDQAAQMQYRRTGGALSGDLSEVVITGNRAQQVPAPKADPRGTVPQTLSRSASDESERSQPEAKLDPETWLANIRQLRKDGKTAEADLEWERFVAAYPDFVVATDDPARKKP